jgi:uncharacterized membrane protein YqgA involved in biofilm formation
MLIIGGHWMPIGILVNIGVVVVGGIVGALLRNVISLHIKDTAFTLFGLGALMLGISSVVLFDDVTIVVLALVLGGLFGEWLKIEDRIRGLLNKAVSLLHEQASDEVITDLVLAIAIFCFSGTAIYGSLLEGLSGDPQVLLTKSILDFFTAIIFAAMVGYSISLIAIPQSIVLFSLFGLATLLSPIMTDSILLNFRAFGGIVIIALVLNVLKIKKIKILNLLPGFVFVILFSYIQTIL